MWIFAVLLILSISQISGQSPINDSRCYLEGGGSAESFLASEDLPIGSVVGTLRINGDPSEDGGDIKLRLRERDAVVEIAPGTKDLVLITSLDKEGVTGPSSVYIDVICDKRHASEDIPSFVIPVNIRVTDVNDNAPQWVGAPYSLPLSEVTVPGTRILQGARAVDKDQQGPFNTVEYQVVPGLYSDYVAFVSPLAGTLVLRKALDYETLPNFTVTLRAQDHGTPPKYSDTQLHVLVEDADDQNPRFLHDAYRAVLPDDLYVGALAVRPEPLRAVDQDVGLCAPVQYAIVPSMESRHFAIDAHSGNVSVVAALPSLNGLLTITLVVRATQINNADRYALTTLVVTGKEDIKSLGKALAFLQTHFHVRIPENTEPGQRLLVLPTNRPGRYLRYTVLNPDEAAYFTVSSLGEIILRQQLDFERAARHTFTILVTDGLQNATAEVNVDVTDVNDWEPRFRHTHYDFTVPISAVVAQRRQALEKSGTRNPEPAAILLGKLEAADGDANDAVRLSVGGAFAQYFHVDGDGLLWLHAVELPTNVSRAHLVATATDTGVPPRSSSVPVTVRLQADGRAMVPDESGEFDGDEESSSESDGMLLTAQRAWNMGVGVFGGIGLSVMAVMVLVIVVMAVYIYGQTQRKSLNRVHSSMNTAGGGSAGNNNDANHRRGGDAGGLGHNAMKSNNQQRMQEPQLQHDSENIRLFTPLQNHTTNNRSHLPHALMMMDSTTDGEDLIISGATAVLAEREAERQREKDNYTATVRSIISRASAARGGLFDMPMDSGSVADGFENNALDDLDKRTSPTTAWNITPRHLHSSGSKSNENEVGVLQRSIKKLSWSHTNNNNATDLRNDAPTVISKQDFLGSSDNIGGTTDNLTVYF